MRKVMKLLKFLEVDLHPYVPTRLWTLSLFSGICGYLISKVSFLAQLRNNDDFELIFFYVICIVLVIPLYLLDRPDFYSETSFLGRKLHSFSYRCYLAKKRLEKDKLTLMEIDEEIYEKIEKVLNGGYYGFSLMSDKPHLWTSDRIYIQALLPYIEESFEKGPKSKFSKRNLRAFYTAIYLEARKHDVINTDSLLLDYMGEFYMLTYIPKPPPRPMTQEDYARVMLDSIFNGRGF